MRVWADHQASLGKDLTCPLCRNDWGAFDWRPMFRPPALHRLRAERDPAAHYGVACASCREAPIAGPRLRCVVCNAFNLCERCFARGAHPQHPFVRQACPGDAEVPTERPSPPESPVSVTPEPTARAPPAHRRAVRRARSEASSHSGAPEGDRGAEASLVTMEVLGSRAARDTVGTQRDAAALLGLTCAPAPRHSPLGTRRVPKGRSHATMGPPPARPDTLFPDAGLPPQRPGANLLAEGHVLGGGACRARAPGDAGASPRGETPGSGISGIALEASLRGCRAGERSERTSLGDAGGGGGGGVRRVSCSAQGRVRRGAPVRSVSSATMPLARTSSVGLSADGPGALVGLEGHGVGTRNPNADGPPGPEADALSGSSGAPKAVGYRHGAATRGTGCRQVRKGPSQSSAASGWVAVVLVFGESVL